jgi:GTP cyclohydrolase I
MPHIQDQREDRGIALDRVGVKSLRHPFVVRDRAGRERAVTATVTAFVSLPAHARATHMSAFLTALSRHSGPLDRDSLRSLLQEIREGLDAPSAGLEIAFPFFVERTAPSTGSRSAMACDARLEAALDSTFRLTTCVRVPVMTLCPCSVSAPGVPGLAQRGYVSVSVRSERAVSVEDLVDLVERCASAPVRPLLRAEDERALLASALARPLFVEDVVRNAVQALDGAGGIEWYEIEAENLESAHDHSVFASCERGR